MAIIRHMNFDAKLLEYKHRVDSALGKWLPKADTRPVRIHEAMRYCLEAGGKRLRPVLLLAAHDLFPSRADPEPAAAAIECLHTYSLIHDDLPGLDNSDLRRGRPSCHVKFDEPTAILTGDALLTQAFYILGDAYGEQPSVGIALIGDLSEAAGSRKLIGGQMEDILSEKTTISGEQLDRIYYLKTGAIITAALTMGISLTDAPSNALDWARAVGLNLGLSYQIIDDILDATVDSASLGKTSGLDAKNDKNTYVRIYGLEKARAKARELTLAALQECERLEADTQFITALIETQVRRLK